MTPQPETQDDSDAAPVRPDAPDEAVGTALSSRRGLLVTAGLVGAAGVAAACGSGDDGGGGTAEPTGGGQTQGGGGGGTELGAATEVPVGGGKVYADQKVVVTQPAAGQYKAFSSACTHRGCAVDEIKGGVIVCPCHGSEFSITDGSVKKPPATKPLESRTVTESGGKLRLA